MEIIIVNPVSIYSLNPLTAIKNEQLSEVKPLLRKIKIDTRTNGVRLTEGESDDMVKLIEKANTQIISSYPDEYAYQTLFWELQVKYNAKRDKRETRWHPVFIKCCIFLKNKAS